MTDKEVADRVEALLANKGRMVGFMNNLFYKTTLCKLSHFGHRDGSSIEIRGLSERGIVLFCRYVSYISFLATGAYIQITKTPGSSVGLDKEDFCPTDSDGLTTVWKDGSWVHRGPWESRIREWLSRLVRFLEYLDEAVRQKADEREAALVAAWSGDDTPGRRRGPGVG
jgi:hypothetical protein